MWGNNHRLPLPSPTCSRGLVSSETPDSEDHPSCQLLRGTSQSLARRDRNGNVKGGRTAKEKTDDTEVSLYHLEVLSLATEEWFFSKVQELLLTPGSCWD